MSKENFFYNFQIILESEDYENFEKFYDLKELKDEIESIDYSENLRKFFSQKPRVKEIITNFDEGKITINLSLKFDISFEDDKISAEELKEISQNLANFSTFIAREINYSFKDFSGDLKVKTSFDQKGNSEAEDIIKDVKKEIEEKLKEEYGGEAMAITAKDLPDTFDSLVRLIFKNLEDLDNLLTQRKIPDYEMYLRIGDLHILKEPFCFMKNEYVTGFYGNICNLKTSEEIKYFLKYVAPTFGLNLNNINMLELESISLEPAYRTGFYAYDLSLDINYKSKAQKTLGHDHIYVIAGENNDKNLENVPLGYWIKKHNEENLRGTGYLNQFLRYLEVINTIYNKDQIEKEHLFKIFDEFFKAYV